MTSVPGPATIDPGDFDAIGVVTDIVIALRRHVMDHAVDATASVSAPPGRHVLRLTARPGGHAVLGVRFDELSRSRRNVLAEALHKRGWDDDADGEGATRRFPPGTEATTVAFEVLAVLTLGGTPPEPRTVTASDASGAPVELS